MIVRREKVIDFDKKICFHPLRRIVYNEHSLLDRVRTKILIKSNRIESNLILSNSNRNLPPITG